MGALMVNLLRAGVSCTCNLKSHVSHFSGITLHHHNSPAN